MFLFNFVSSSWILIVIITWYQHFILSSCPFGLQFSVNVLRLVFYMVCHYSSYYFAVTIAKKDINAIFPVNFTSSSLPERNENIHVLYNIWNWIHIFTPCQLDENLSKTTVEYPNQQKYSRIETKIINNCKKTTKNQNLVKLSFTKPVMEAVDLNIRLETKVIIFLLE